MKYELKYRLGLKSSFSFNEIFYIRDDILKWCKENCIEKYNCSSTSTELSPKVTMLCVFRFESDIDVMAFKLRWL